MGNFFKDIVAPAVGGIGGFLIGGPPGAAIGTGLGLMQNSAQQAAKGGQQANDLNMYLAHHQYEIMMNDLRRAGLNPILAAGGGFTPGSHSFQNPYAQSSQITGNMAQSAIASGTDVYRALNEKHNITSQIKDRTSQILKRDRERRLLDITEQLMKSEIGLNNSKSAESMANKLYKLMEKNLVEAQIKVLGKDYDIKEAEAYKKQTFNRFYSEVERTYHDLVTKYGRNNVVRGILFKLYWPIINDVLGHGINIGKSLLPILSNKGPTLPDTWLP